MKTRNENSTVCAKVWDTGFIRPNDPRAIKVIATNLIYQIGTKKLDKCSSIYIVNRLGTKTRIWPKQCFLYYMASRAVVRSINEWIAETEAFRATLPK